MPLAGRRAALPAGLVGLVLLAPALATGPGAAPAAPALQAVVSYDGALPPVDGVRVRSRMPAVGGALVTGDAGALRRLASSPGVRSVVPDAAVRVTSGPLPTDRWGVPGWASLEAPAELGAGAGVRVAVVDTGVSDTEALDRASGRLVDAVDTRGVREGGQPVLGGAEGPLVDEHGHGTFQASLIAGDTVAGSRGYPVGVASGATVLVVRVAEADGATSLSQVVAGLDWVAAHPEQVDVLSLALAVDAPDGTPVPDPLTVAVERVREAGVVAVVSAGNDPDRVGDPGYTPGALTVGAADPRTGEVAARSGSGAVAGQVKPDLVAAGASVFGVLPPESALARANPRAHLTGHVYRGSGTSQATAVVSGAAAVLLAQSPGLDPDDVKATLRAGAVDLPGERDGAGLLTSLTAVTEGASPFGDAAPPAGGSGDAWSADSWSAAANAWSANSWSANSWSANSWSANSWSANSWSANSWSANSWSANSWSANSWSANSWSTDAWGEEAP